jgi:hypothetical protein
MMSTMGFGTLYVHADGDVDEAKSEIEDLKKKTKYVRGWLYVRKLDAPKPSVTNPDQPNIMVEFNYDQKTNLEGLEQQVSGISGVRIVKSVASL